MQGQRNGTTGARRLALVVALMTLSACSETIVNHGYAPPEAQLALVQPGVDGKLDVERKIGLPADDGVLGGDTWYYISSTVRNYLYEAPQVVDRRLVAVRFDETDTVTTVATYGIEDGREVPLVLRTTETFGQERSAVQQLIGNLFNLELDE